MNQGKDEAQSEEAPGSRAPNRRNRLENRTNRLIFLLKFEIDFQSTDEMFKSIENRFENLEIDWDWYSLID